MIRYLVIFIGLAIIGCKPSTQISTKPVQGGKYYEDLSAYRPKIDEPKLTETPKENSEEKRDPKVYMEPQYTVNQKLNSLLDSIDRINLTQRFIDGYTIQVYSGLKREDAMSTRKELSGRLPDIESVLQYVQPNFRVKAGKYSNQLEAQRDFIAIKRYFPTAILVPDRIAIN